MSVRNVSLRAQLNCVILFILSLSFVGSVWINVFNAQQFLSNQLESHAQDTATSLGLSLSDAILENEPMVIEGTINAIFDRGFYHHIILEDVNGTALYQRTNLNQPEQVPTWFTNLFKLNAPEQKSMIDTGWTIGGILKVQSHTGHAYAQLWSSANDFSHATLFIFALALLFGYLVLQQVYKPINEISLQANAVQKREFILITKMPRAKELHNFVLAMNQMVMNIKNTFEELTEAAERTRKVAYIDSQTGIPNRRAFNDTLDAMLSPSAEHQGYIIMVRVTGLAHLNKHKGYIAGDSLLTNLIHNINNEVKDILGYQLCRVSGSELCFFINNLHTLELELLINRIIKKINRHIEILEENKIGFGGISFKSGDDLSKIMYQLDRATNNALESSAAYFITSEYREDEPNQKSASSFKAKIEGVISNSLESIQLKGQKSASFSTRTTFSTEFFASFTYKDEDLNTGDVFSTAAQFNLTAALDLAILKQVLSTCPAFVAGNEKVAINLSRLTFADEETMHQLIELIKQSSFANNLVIGVTEATVISGVKEAMLPLRKLADLGCSICVNHFGSSIESLKYLMEVRPDFVKLETAFTRNIDTKDNNEQLISDFVRMAHGLNIAVIAQCVETEEELSTLKKLNVDSVLGYIIEKPKYF